MTIKKKIYLKPFFPYVALIIGIVITIIAWSYINIWMRKQSETEFEIKADQILNFVDLKLNRDSNLLLGARGLFDASDSVDRDEFYAYINNLEIAKNYPGISNIGFAQNIKDVNKNDFLKLMQNDSSSEPLKYSNIKIYPINSNENHSILKYLYPEEKSLSGIGFDMLSEEKRRTAIENARISNSITATEKIYLVTDNEPAILMVLPVYNNIEAKNISGNMDDCYGFILVSINLNKFFPSILDIDNIDFSNFDLHIYNKDDNHKNIHEDILFDFDKDNALFESKNKLAIERYIQFADKTWEFHFVAKKDFGLTFIDKALSIFIGLLGIIFSVLLFFILKSAIATNSRAQELAEELLIKHGESEEKFRLITESAKDAIIMMDNMQKIVLWNKAATEMFGYSSNEVIGKELHSIIPFEKDHRIKKDRLNHFAKTGESDAINQALELPVKRKDGTRLVVELTIGRVKLKGLWHAIGIMRDISVRKIQEEIVKQKTSELERLNRAMIGREIKMAELKNQIKNAKDNK